MSNIWNELKNGIQGALSPVPVVPVWTLGVVVAELFVQVALQSLNRLIEVFPEGNAEELVQYRLVETLNKSVGFGRPDLCLAALDVVQSEVKFIRMGFSVPQNSRPLSVRIADTTRPCAL